MRYQPRLVQPVITPAVEQDDKPDTVATIWRIWVQASTRTQDTVLTDEYRTRLGEAIADGDWEDQPDHLLERAVRAAAYHPPVPGDDHDIERLIAVVSDEDSRGSALASLTSVTSMPFMFNDIPDLMEVYQTTAEVTNATETDRMTVWELTEHSQELLYTVCDDLRQEGSEVTPDTVLSRLKDINSNLYPVTNPENRARRRPKKKSSADAAYSAARTMDEVSVLVRNDLQGRDMISEKYPMATVINHHNAVPNGYWERVDEEIMKPDSGDLMDIYELLEAEFDFHPEDREIPAKK